MFCSEELLAVRWYGQSRIVRIEAGSRLREVGHIRSNKSLLSSPEVEGRLAAVSIDSGCVDVFDMTGGLAGTLLAEGASALCVGRSGRWCGTGDLVRGLRGSDREWAPLPYEEILSRQQASCAWSEVLGRTAWYDDLVLLGQRFVALAERGVRRYDQLEAWQKVVFWPGIAYLAILALWVVRPSALARWAMRANRDEVEGGGKGGAGGVAEVAKVVALVRTLGEGDRAVYAWLRKNAARLNRRFDVRTDVQYRRSYAVSDEFAAAIETWQAVTHGRDGRPLWIWGPGGCGKTSLAMHAARARRDAGRGSRGKRQKCVAVVVDNTWPSSLEDRIAYLLRDDGRQLSAAMVRRLGRMGSLVLLIDGESELTVPDARIQVQRLCEATAWKWLVVTSRRPPADAELWQGVEVGPLDGPRIEAVVQVYGGAGWVAVAGAVLDWCRGRSMKAGIVRKAVGLVVAGRDLPLTEVDMVREHLRGISPRGEGKLAEEEFLRAVRVCAVACTTNGGQPRVVSRDFLLGFVAAAVSRFVDHGGSPLEAPEVVTQLVECGVLEVVQGDTLSDVRFAEDFVAETAVGFAA
jgi:hypothetical protein